MADEQDFQGFTERCPAFFRELAANNQKSWFDQHRQEYETAVLEPSRLLVSALGPRLKTIRPGVIADPRINRSLFRLNRDTRFSKSKLPYKTHLGIIFWEGDTRLGSPCFYLHLSPSSLMLAVGIYEFSKEQLERYRAAVDRTSSGEKLAGIVSSVRDAGYQIGGEHYKRVPGGFDPEHDRADLLRYNGLGAMAPGDLPQSLHSADFVDYCFDRFREMDPINGWLADNVM